MTDSMEDTLSYYIKSKVGEYVDIIVNLSKFIWYEHVQAKSRTLKEIQQDRENMKLRHHHKQPTSISSTTGPGTVEGSSKPLNNKKNARIQVKRKKC